MLTGSTVEEWDTMLYFKDTASPQEYDQAVFRLQNQYIKTYTEPDGDVVKYNMKPQTLLVDFDPNRMFRMQEQKSQIYNVNTEANGNTLLEARIKRELEISPVVMLNNQKIVQVQPADVLDAVRKYASDKSVLDEATAIPVDFSLLDNPLIRAEIEKQGKLGSKQGLEIRPNIGEGEEMDIPEGDEKEMPGIDKNKTSKPIPETDEDDFESKFATYYSRILFFSFLTNSQVKSLQDVIQAIEADESNARIAGNLDINKAILMLLHDSMNPFILSKLDYKIQNINTLANDSTLQPIERASSAMKKFSRISDSEIVTPEKLTDEIVGILPADEITKTTTMLDIAAKQGEFVYAVYKRFGKQVADNFYSIPTSKITYEFTLKVYTLLGLNTAHVVSDFTAYDLLTNKSITENKQMKIGNIYMNFDIIVGNPPYQESDGGAQMSASPIYQKFIQISKGLNPHFISMIVPARWYNGGKGLDEFRNEMLSDLRIRELHDYPDTTDCFIGLNIRGGICYFLWDKKHNDKCSITTHKGGKIGTPVKRRLMEKGLEVFVRYNEAINVLNKVQSKKEKTFNSLVSARKPFGLPTNYTDFKTKNTVTHNTLLYRFGQNGYVSKSDIDKNIKAIHLWKVLVPYASPGDDSYPHLILSKPLVVGENTCCTETYLLVGPFENETIANNVSNYMKTKFFRFMILLAKSTQHITQKNYSFVPIQDFTKQWTDADLYKKYGISEEEITFIDSMIKPIE